MEERHLSTHFLKSLSMPHKSLLLPSIIPNISHCWKILTPLGSIQICYVHPVPHITAGERIFWSALHQKTNKIKYNKIKMCFNTRHPSIQLSWSKKFSPDLSWHEWESWVLHNFYFKYWTFVYIEVVIFILENI